MFEKITRVTWALSLALFFLLVIPSVCNAAEQSEKKVIREIKILINDVFTGDNVSGIYSIANGLKVNTKEDIVVRELLFKPGDKYDSFVVQESARNLRSLPFLRDIKITEVVDGEFVDIVVSVQDVWTFFPVFSLSSGSGTQSSSVGLVEGNLLGYGKRVEALLAEDEGRRKYEMVFDDRRFLGSLQRFSLAHFERSDGRRSLVSWGLPFRSLVNKAAWFTEVDASDLVGRMFTAADEDFIYRQEHQSFMGGYTISSGNPSDTLLRYTLGYSYVRDEFQNASSSDYADIGLDESDFSDSTREIASDRRYSGPSVSFQRIIPDFVTLNYLDNFDRPQDINLGNEFVTNLQIAPEFMGSLHDSYILKVTDTDGVRLGPSHFFRYQGSGSLRFEKDTFRQIVLGAQARYYNVFGPSYIDGTYVGQHTLASNFAIQSAYKEDNDFQYQMGSSNGIRGYDDRAFTGSHRMLANFEDRVHFVDDVAKLFSVGGATFFDVGGVYEDNISDFLHDGVYASVGVGLRLGLLRSSGGTVVRIDLSVPLRDGPDGSLSGEPRLLFTTGQLFNAFLRSDAPSLQSPTISAGF